MPLKNYHAFKHNTSFIVEYYQVAVVISLKEVR